MVEADGVCCVWDMAPGLVRKRTAHVNVRTHTHTQKVLRIYHKHRMKIGFAPVLICLGGRAAVSYLSCKLRHLEDRWRTGVCAFLSFSEEAQDALSDHGARLLYSVWGLPPPRFNVGSADVEHRVSFDFQIVLQAPETKHQPGS